MIKGIPIILKLLDLTDEQLCLFDIAVNTHFLLPQHHIFEKLVILNLAFSIFEHSMMICGPRLLISNDSITVAVKCC